MVELILYMGLLGVLLSVLTGIFTSALDVQLESQATSAVEQDGRFILARVMHDIHRATSVTTPGAPGAQTQTLSFVAGGTTYTYAVNASGNLTLSSGGQENVLNSYGTGVSQFTVQRIGNVGGVEDSFHVTFTLTSKTERSGGPEVKQFQTTTSLRRL